MESSGRAEKSALNLCVRACYRGDNALSALKKVYLACASGIDDSEFIRRMRDMRDAVFSTSGVDPDPTCCTVTSADLFAGFLDFWSEDLDIHIRIRSALRKPLLLFHPASSQPSAILKRLVLPNYPEGHARRIFRPYASAADVSEAIAVELCLNGRLAARIVRVVC